jgi:hypothetical protein
MTVLQMMSYTLTTKMKGSTKSVCHNTIQPWFKRCVVYLPPTSGMHSWPQLQQCSKHGWTENINISSQSESLFCTAGMTQLHNWNLLLSSDLTHICQRLKFFNLRMIFIYVTKKNSRNKNLKRNFFYSISLLSYEAFQKWNSAQNHCYIVHNV